MTDQPDSMLVHCGSCKHEWFALKLPMLMRDAAEKIMTLECPHCTRRSKIYCGPAPVGEKTTDDLVKRLRSLGSAGPGRISFLASEDAMKAADLIEKLEFACGRHIDEINRMVGCWLTQKARVEKLEAALREIIDQMPENFECYHIARKALAAE